MNLDALVPGELAERVTRAQAAAGAALAAVAEVYADLYGDVRAWDTIIATWPTELDGLPEFAARLVGFDVVMSRLHTAESMLTWIVEGRTAPLTIAGNVDAAHLPEPVRALLGELGARHYVPDGGLVVASQDATDAATAAEIGFGNVTATDIVRCAR